MNNLIRTLYKSRRRTKNGIIYRGDVVDVVNELVEAAKEKGLTISRWENHDTPNPFVLFITWAAHEGEKPEAPKQLPAYFPKIYLSASEGTTTKCAAYRRLRVLLGKVKGYEKQLELLP